MERTKNGLTLVLTKGYQHLPTITVEGRRIFPATAEELVYMGGAAVEPTEEQLALYFETCKSQRRDPFARTMTQQESKRGGHTGPERPVSRAAAAE